MNFLVYMICFVLAAGGVLFGILRKNKIVLIVSILIAAVFAVLCVCTLLLLGGID